jgi:hypothetical protein
MPYKDRANVALRQPTKERLADMKGEEQTWDELLRELAGAKAHGGDRQ